MSTCDIHAVLISQVSSTYFFQFPAHIVHTGSLQSYYILARCVLQSYSICRCCHSCTWSFFFCSLFIKCHLANRGADKSSTCETHKNKATTRANCATRADSTSATWIQTTNDYNIIMKIIIDVLLSNFSSIKCGSLCVCEHWTQTNAYVFVCANVRAFVYKRDRSFCYVLVFLLFRDSFIFNSLRCFFSFLGLVFCTNRARFSLFSNFYSNRCC